MKVKHLFIPAALFAVWRAHIIITVTQQGTGFLPRGSVTGWVYIVPVLLLCAWLYFIAWKKVPGSDHTGCGAMVVGGFSMQAGMTLCAAGLIVSALLSLKANFYGNTLFVVVSVVAAICTVLMLPTASGKRTVRAGTDAYLALGLVAWGVFALLGVFLANNTITPVPENMLSLLSMAALLAALFSLAKLRAGFASAGQFLSSMSVAALLSTTTQLPGILLRFFGYADRFVSNSSQIDVAIFFMLPMMWMTLLVVEKHAAKASADNTEKAEL